MGVIYGKELNLSMGKISMLEKGQASRNQLAFLQTYSPSRGMTGGVVGFSTWPCHCIMIGVV